MEGVIFSTFIVVFREALEASLIIGIILMLLYRLNAKQYISHVFAGIFAALIVSYGLGLWLSSLTESAQGNAGPAIEGVISLAACAVLTYMFFWMEKQARYLKSDIEIKMETALSKQDYLAIVSLPFISVLREGAETVLFLKAVSIQSGGSVSWAGGLSGCALALMSCVLLFIGGKRVPIGRFFRITGFFIVLIAAGLLAYGIHELNEIGWIPSGVENIYNINHILNDKKGIGSFLKALFGYNGNPSLTETVGYWTYLSVMIFMAFKPKGGAVASRS